MSSSQNLVKFEWENVIPFRSEIVKSTISAMIGEEKVLGLISYNTKGNKWGLNCASQESNDTFGTYAFGQVNSSFNITVSVNDENSTKLHIDVLNRQGGIYSNQSQLQAECNKLIKAITYYLEHNDEVLYWHEHKEENIKKYESSGCSVIIPVIIAISSAIVAACSCF